MSASETGEKQNPSQEFRAGRGAAKFILAKTKLRPRIGLVLGSGLGAFANEIPERRAHRLQKNSAFSALDGDRACRAHGDRQSSGRAGGGDAGARAFLRRATRRNEVIFPMRVMARMGIRAVVLTNAAGGINRSFKQGCLVVLRDHINLQGTNPLIGPNDDHFGVRFPDMTQVYWKAVSGGGAGRRKAPGHRNGRGRLRRADRAEL